jgi:hypothetical protein
MRICECQPHHAGIQTAQPVCCQSGNRDFALGFLCHLGWIGDFRCQPAAITLSATLKAHVWDSSMKRTAA